MKKLLFHLSLSIHWNVSLREAFGLSQPGQHTDGPGGSMPAMWAAIINLTDFPLVLFLSPQLQKTDVSANDLRAAEAVALEEHPVWATWTETAKLFFYCGILKYSDFVLKLKETLFWNNKYFRYDVLLFWSILCLRECPVQNLDLVVLYAIHALDFFWNVLATQGWGTPAIYGEWELPFLMWIADGASLSYAETESWKGIIKLAKNIKELCWRNRPVTVTHCRAALELYWEMDQLTQSQRKDFE